MQFVCFLKYPSTIDQHLKYFDNRRGEDFNCDYNCSLQKSMLRSYAFKVDSLECQSWWLFHFFVPEEIWLNIITWDIEFNISYFCLKHYFSLFRNPQTRFAVNLLSFYRIHVYAYTTVFLRSSTSIKLDLMSNGSLGFLLREFLIKII